MPLTAAIDKRYSNKAEKVQAIRQSVLEACQKFIASGHGDYDAELKLCSEVNAKYWQQLSEVLLADQLTKAGLKILHPAEGPDFLIEIADKKIWIEVITPEPTGLPKEWLDSEQTEHSMPHEAMLLRWTAAIKEKAEKLLGYECRKTKSLIKGYVEKGIVSPQDAYVIAVNGRLLRRSSGCFPELIGISQFPFAVEATFCVGPIKIGINRETLETTSVGHQHRDKISKPIGQPVPADTFIDPRFSPISAIWAVDIDELILIGESRPMVVVHNPNATNPIPKNLIPAQSEYVALDKGDHYQLDRHDR